MVATSAPLDVDQLRAIGIGLRGKLRALQISESFIDRNGEDLIQQALTEYTRAIDQGRKIENPGGWVVHTAARRAIDQLRRESREAGHVPDEIVAGAPDYTSTPPEDEAIQHVQVEQLHQAISHLSVSQRQALSLYYFEEKTTRESAEALGWSEPTFRRRRDSALSALRKRFGVTVPEFDVGLAAWLSLTAGVGTFSRLTDPVVAAADSVRSFATATVDRGRDLVVRLLSSGGGETAIGASAPVGRAAGICAAAVVACATTGVIGPGVGGFDLVERQNNTSPVEKQRTVAPARPSPAPRIAAPEPPTRSNPNQTPKANTSGSSRRDSGGSSTREERTGQARRDATSQFGVESGAAPPASSTQAAPAPPASTSPPASSSSAPSPSQAANDQFGLP